jgi:cytochrome d ubiquinol oxidase subunit I
VIFGLLKTVDAVSPVPAQTLLATLIAFVCIYASFMTAFLFFVVRILRRGPESASIHAEASGSLKNAFRPQVLDSANADAAFQEIER